MYEVSFTAIGKWASTGILYKLTLNSRTLFLATVAHHIWGRNGMRCLDLDHGICAEFAVALLFNTTRI